MTQPCADLRASVAVMVYGINQFIQNAKLLLTMTSEESDSETNGNVPTDHDRLRHVTRFLAAQQGLRTILSGTLLFWIEANDIWHWHWTSGWVGGVAWLVGLLVFVRAWQRWIPMYYERRFGHVEAQEMSGKQFGIFLLVLLALALIGQPVANYVEPKVSSFLSSVHLLISDPAQQVNLYVPFLWMAAFLCSLWHLRRTERQRLCFEFAGLVGFASLALFPMWHPNGERLGLWRVLNSGALGLSFIAVGLYDHIVLVRALPRRLVGDHDE